MILTILATIFFFISFIIFSFLGYKRRSGWSQFIAINSFIVSTNSFKEFLPSNYTYTINITRITVGLLIIGIFAYHDFHNNETTST